MITILFYAICSINTDKFYIGCTTKNNISDIYKQYSDFHLQLIKSKTYTPYRKVFEIFSYDDTYFKLIEEVSLDDEKDLKKVIRRYKKMYRDKYKNKVIL